MTADAVYVAYEGADVHLSGDPLKQVISRGVPVRKAVSAVGTRMRWSRNRELTVKRGWT